MKRKLTIWVVAVLLLCLGGFALVRCPIWLAANGEDPDDEMIRLSLYPEDKRPEKFEPFLKENPESEERRSYALRWYSRDERAEKDFDKLKHHTREMIKYHPENMYIYIQNIVSFYRHPEYRLEVIQLLEEQVAAGQSQHGVYGNLAQACEQGAIPPPCDTPEKKAGFLRYYGLSENTQLPTEVDAGLADKAEQYFRAAITASTGADFRIAFYSRQLADLLVELDKLDEAVAVCERALPYVKQPFKSNFLVTYGACLKAYGRADDAKQILSQVREIDTEGFQEGPAHATTDAETQLGLIALKEGNTDTAKQYLLSSCDVQRCCHNSTMGLPLVLARKLLKMGQCEVVAKYSRKVVEGFTPWQKETEDLLQKAMRGATTPTRNIGE